MRACPDLSLYLILGAADTAGTPFEEVVLSAVAGGVSVVQLRDKHTCARDQVANAKRLKALLAPRGVPLIVNDRVDVALAAGADGVHLGQDDMHAADARRLIGEEMLIGTSVHNAHEAAGVDPELVDYVGIGPVFGTGSKADPDPAIGPEGVAELSRQVGLPAVAIGGITGANAGQLAGTGVDGLAVISAICHADDPGAAAQRIRRSFGADNLVAG
ncbi:thiamine-phosphate pyrophosphorylase [Limimonas halophila]|uniref:Thiamine-phosphate synthase n=1 Tax=Limimonas halophila TaxID=1082479 RepID=A0A1G7SZT7_9PROT|nr:thiamine phosphate synthase [Limimonas halophila]SDG28583.1 thiamine-phosphate pyrophosphorylase [Limimonas halophila]